MRRCAKCGHMDEEHDKDGCICNCECDGWEPEVEDMDMLREDRFVLEYEAWLESLEGGDDAGAS